MAPAASAVETPTPAAFRAAVVRGVRWTMWLAVLSLPCSYGTRVLLAHCGAQALAAFGLLTVYLNFVAAFPFLGGNAVAIRYLPQMRAGRRRTFLRAYAGLIFTAWLPWVAVAIWKPGWLTWLFGSLGGSRFSLVMMALAPVPILYSLSLAALKGVLELAWAQWIYRGVTLACFVGYLPLALLPRRPFWGRDAWIIWGWYLGVAAAGIWIACNRLRRHCPQAAAGPGGASLPRGFFAYTGSLQAASMLGFFATQLDMILVLHMGGVRVFGGYVALMSLVLLGLAGLKMLLDGYMSAVTNAVVPRASRSDGAAGESGDAGRLARVWRAYTRLLLPLITGFAALLALGARPLLAVYGRDYAGLAPALVCLAGGAALDGLNCLFGSTLAALGRPQDEVKAKLVRIAVFVALFVPLWRAWGVLGAALAWSGAEAPYLAFNVWYLRLRLPFALGWARTYWSCVGVVAGAVALGSTATEMPAAMDFVLWVGAVAAFFFAAGYGREELRTLLRLITPGAIREEWI